MPRATRISAQTPVSTPPPTPFVPFLVALLVIAGFVIGMLVNKVETLQKDLAQAPGAAPTPKPVTLDQIKALFTEKNLAFGDKNNKNLIVEVADPSCPFCHAAGGRNPELNKQIGPQFLTVAEGGTYAPPVPEIEKLVKEGKASFVYIYFPGHGSGEMGAKALYCADEKGKFWEVHDKLMTNDGYTLMNTQVKNDLTKSQDVANFLADAIDPTFLKSCLDSNKYAPKLTEDTNTARNLNVRGTPGFFIGTTSYPGAYSWTDMKSAVK